MNWLDSFCFISVARTRSFSVTARELSISQQAVSRHIQNLEKELGRQLFFRGYNGIFLTKAGEQMLQCLIQREDLVKSFKKTLENPADVVRIAWSQWLGCPEQIRNRLRRFCIDHPEVTVITEELSDQEVQASLSENRLDLLLTSDFTRKRLNFPVLATTLEEEPLFLLTASHTNVLPSLHFATPAGTETQDSVKRSIRKEYARFGLTPGSIEIMDNPRSVFLNVLLKNGTAFTVSHRYLSENPRFDLHPLDRTVTTVLCLPPHPAAPWVLELETALLQKEEHRI